MEDSDNADPATAKKPADDAATAPANEVAELKAEVAKLTNSLARLIRTSSKSSETPDGEKRKPSADDELKKRVDALDQKAQRIAARTQRQTAREAFLAAGLASDAIDDAVDLFMTRNAGKISCDDADAVFITDSELDGPVDLREYIGKQAKAGKYDRYKAAKAAPTKGFSGTAGARTAKFTLPIRGSSLLHPQGVDWTSPRL